MLELLAGPAVSTIMGYVFKMIANSQEDRARRDEQMIRALAQEEVAVESARAFSGGIWARRIIVTVVAFVFLFLTVGSGFLEGPTSIIYETEPSGLFSLFYNDGANIEIKEVNGMVFPLRELFVIIFSIIGFYFGSGAAKRGRR